LISLSQQNTAYQDGKSRVYRLHPSLAADTTTESAEKVHVSGQGRSHGSGFVGVHLGEPPFKTLGSAPTSTPKSGSAQRRPPTVKAHGLPAYSIKRMLEAWCDALTRTVRHSHFCDASPSPCL